MAARATGAFPIALAPRVIARRRSEYEKRLWTIDNAQPNAAGQCQEQDPVMPAWDDNLVPKTFLNPYVDGGVTNNNPFECAREYLADAAGNDGHNPREAEKANAAVLSVAPFPGEEPFNPYYNAEEETEIAKVLGGLIGILVNQSRYQGENLILAKDPNVYSRFVIAPSDDTAQGKPALLCGALGAFGGFVDRKFRDHDYQLGRRNCQKFLKDVFMLPEDNVTIQPGVAKQAQAAAALQRDFAASQPRDARKWYPVVPLMPAVAVEVPATNRADFYTTPARLEEVAEAAEQRFKTVLHAFVNTPGDKHKWLTFLMDAIFLFGGGGKIKAAILAKLKTELADQTAG
jgi:hypothetical protein